MVNRTCYKNAILIIFFLIIFNFVVISEEKKMNSVECSFVLEKDTFVLGEPIYLIYKIKNQISNKIIFIVGNGRKDSFEFNVINSNNLNKYKVLNPYYEFGGITAKRFVESGQDYSYRILLNKYINFCKEGKFDVECKGNFPVEDGKDNLINIKNIGVVHFKIKEDKKTFLKIIKNLQSKLSDNHYEIREEAIRALTSIRQEEVIKILASALKNEDEYIVEIALDGLGEFRDNDEAKKIVTKFASDHKGTRLGEWAERIFEKWEK
ncbi:MAG: HEAT repeat domain-containing protein [Candidatus Firestonebacteria bacterium]